MNLLDNDDITELVDPFADGYLLGGRTAMLGALTAIARAELPMPLGVGTNPRVLALTDLQRLKTMEPIDGSVPMITALHHLALVLAGNASAAGVVRGKLDKARRTYRARVVKDEVRGKLSAAEVRSVTEATALARLGLVAPGSPWAGADASTLSVVADALGRSGSAEHVQLKDAVPELAGTALGDEGLEGLRSRYSRLVPAFFTRAMEACDQVARIYVDGTPGSFGTGWMLTSELMITCWHVLAGGVGVAEDTATLHDINLAAARVCLHFADEPPIEGARDPDVRGAKVEAGLWSAQPGGAPLDFVILRIDDQGDRRDGLAVERRSLTLGDAEAFVPANIPQYADGQSLLVGIRANAITRTDRVYITYETDTEHGSSGSPVCSDGWRAFALHREGLCEGNRGTLTGAIFDWLQRESEPLFREIEAQGKMVR